MDFRTQSVIMTLGCVCVCGGGLSLMTFWNSEKLSNFKAHELWWTINELCTGILRVPSCCLPIAHIHKRTLLKNHPSAVFSFKMQHKRQNKHTHTQTHTHTHTHTHKRFYQCSSKNINQNMFCTKSRLLTQKTVIKVSLFRFFVNVV